MHSQQSTLLRQCDQCPTKLCHGVQQADSCNLVLIIVGTEGTGHHLWDLFVQPDVPDFIGWIVSLFGPTKGLSFPKVAEGAQYFLREACVAHGVAISITSSPFTVCRQGRRCRGGCTQRVDFAELLAILPPYVNLKLIVLTRDPVAAVGSALRREMASSAFEQARVVVGNLNTLELGLQWLPPNVTWVGASYEETLQTPDVVINKVCAAIGQSLCDEVFFFNTSVIHPPRTNLTHEDLAPHIPWLRSYFQRHASHWPLLMASTISPEKWGEPVYYS